MISSLIHEYLLKKDYPNTLDAFQAELNTKIKSKEYYKAGFDVINEVKILRVFSSGDKKEFFKQWNRIIPSHIKNKDPQFSKLEFFLEIYFAIYPILGQKQITNQNMKDLKSNMEDFKRYLDTKEIELSKTTEFLAYYALPYVPNPRDHPSFQTLFTAEWQIELKEKIKQCIKSYLPSVKYPVLYDLVTGSDEDQAKIDAMRNYLEKFSGKEDIVDINGPQPAQNRAAQPQYPPAEYEKLLDDLRKYKAKEEKNKIAFVDSQKTWTHLALNIINYSFDLVNLGKKNNSGSPETSEKIEKINKKLIKYQNFLKKNSDELEKNKANSSNLCIKNEEMDIMSNSKYDESIRENENVVRQSKSQLRSHTNTESNQNNPPNNKNIQNPQNIQNISIKKEVEGNNNQQLVDSISLDESGVELYFRTAYRGLFCFCCRDGYIMDIRLQRNYIIF